MICVYPLLIYKYDTHLAKYLIYIYIWVRFININLIYIYIYKSEMDFYMDLFYISHIYINMGQT